ncbi:MAG: hypothetical protein LLG06_03000 [Desulfobacteraceae bacterium]|nr:hypothetical protein [Desulfobacteraceae bacterium]
MLLELDGVEFEIRQGRFVCIDKGTASRFCEWESMTPRLRKAFTNLQADILKLVEDFLLSEDLGGEFTAISEEYRLVEPEPCPSRRTL